MMRGRPSGPLHRGGIGGGSNRGGNGVGSGNGCGNGVGGARRGSPSPSLRTASSSQGTTSSSQGTTSQGTSTPKLIFLPRVSTSSRHHRSKRNNTVVFKYCEEMNELNEAANNRPRSALIHSIQQENRHIRELQQENKELRQALEEHQNVMELIMSKYRQQVAKLVSVNATAKQPINTEDQAKLAKHIERVNEMVVVMRQAAQLDEEESHKQQQLITALALENKGLREMLNIATRQGSIQRPSTSSDAQTQTETADSHLQASVASPEPHSSSQSSSSHSQGESEAHLVSNQIPKSKKESETPVKSPASPAVIHAATPASSAPASLSATPASPASVPIPSSPVLKTSPAPVATESS